MRDKSTKTTLLVSGQLIKNRDAIGSQLFSDLEDDEQLINIGSAASGRFGRLGVKSCYINTFKKRRDDIYAQAAHILKHFNVRQILFFPVVGDDLLLGIAAADITGAPMALLLSECSDNEALLAARELMKEAVRKSTLCFANSEKIRASFQRIHNRRLWILTVPEQGRQSSASRNVSSWLWRSLSQGTPVDNRFERICDDELNRTTPYVDPDPPVDVHWEFRPHFFVLNRLKTAMYRPDFVVDVGASTGLWSHIAASVFPEAKFVLVEPLLKWYLKENSSIYDLHPGFIRLPLAAGKERGEMEMNVSPDLYSSSFFDSTHAGSSLERISVKPLDEIALAEGLQGRGILKIDVQFSEHLVLEGAAKFLQQIDFIFVEISLKRFLPNILVYSEMIALLGTKGFDYFDHAGGWRDPITGELLQQDVIFARSKIRESGVSGEI